MSKFDRSVLLILKPSLLDHDVMASILVGNLNSGHSFLITDVLIADFGASASKTLNATSEAKKAAVVGFQLLL